MLIKRFVVMSYSSLERLNEFVLSRRIQLTDNVQGDWLTLDGTFCTGYGVGDHAYVFALVIVSDISEKQFRLRTA